MMKRYLDCRASDLANIDKDVLLRAIRASEGRIIVSEVIGSVQPMLITVTNAEFASSQGADMLLFNIFDVDNPVVNGLPIGADSAESIKVIKRLTGRTIGINLEPVESGFHGSPENLWRITPGRLATVANADKAADMGVNFIVLTGNPDNGVSNSAICSALRAIKSALGNKLILIAGKMHAAGILQEAAEKIITKDDIKGFINAGADIVLIPAPATVPGISLDYVRELIAYAHSLGALTMTAIGTSQEGADQETIRQIALMCKMAGTDLHHIGDTGYAGMALPENILTYSIAIRGRRHTYIRIAASVNR
jgi:hypothetical protein